MILDRLESYISESKHHTSIYSGEMDFDDVLLEYVELESKEDKEKFLSHLNKEIRDKIIKMKEGGLIL